MTQANEQGFEQGDDSEAEGPPAKAAAPLKTYAVPDGYETVGSNVAGYWDPDQNEGSGPIEFRITGVRLIDNGKEKAKSSCLILGELLKPCRLIKNSPKKEEQVLEEFGRIDCLVNNAALMFDQLTATWDDFLAVNFMGVVNASNAVIPHMWEQRRGSIVNIASTAAFPLEIPLIALDEIWRVRYRRTTARGVQVREHDGRVLELSGAVHDESACRARLRRWLAEKARVAFEPWLDRLSERTGLTYHSLQIRGQRTRWGSCSTQRTISLNFRLLFLARPLVRYLLIHELCHTRHMNHGSRFWALVQSLEPQAQALDTELGEAWREVPGWATVI